MPSAGLTNDSTSDSPSETAPIGHRRIGRSPTLSNSAITVGPTGIPRPPGRVRRQPLEPSLATLTRHFKDRPGIGFRRLALHHVVREDMNLFRGTALVCRRTRRYLKPDCAGEHARIDRQVDRQARGRTPPSHSHVAECRTPETRARPPEVPRHK